ncbi:MAG: Gfo/Idh/MocA family protein [Acutalibacteraceae bacterium]
MVKIGVLGVGGISTAHINSWLSLEGAELAAICDIRPEQMEKWKGVRHYTSFDDMVKNEELDIIDICLPTYLHAEYSLKAMNLGLNVLCEKPISLHPEDVRKIYEAAAKNKVNFMIAHCLRFWPEYIRLKQVCDCGEYGKLISGSVSRLGNRPGWSWDNWMADEKRSGLVPFDLHIHDLDFLVYCFGKPKDYRLFRAKRPEQDFLSVTYDYGDFFITGEASWYAACHPFKSGFRFQFEKAVLAFENGKLTEYLLNGEKKEFEASESPESGNAGIPSSNAYFNEIEYFKNCVENRVFPDVVKERELKDVLDIITTF